MKHIAIAAAVLLTIAGTLRAVENSSWATVKAQEPAAKLVMSATKAGSGADYLVSGTGQSDPVDFFHLLFNWFKAMDITPYDDQYKDSRWIFISPFQAIGNDCQTQSYTPDAASAALMDMVVCDPAKGAEVRGFFHLVRRLENDRPYAFDPAALFAYPVIEEKPYTSWVGGSDARIVKFVLKGNRAALVAEDAEGGQILWLVEDNGYQPIQKTMGSVENMLTWKGDRRSYITSQDVWTAEEGIGSPEHLLYAATRGELESWPANNKHLKAWPMGDVKVKSY